MLPTRWSKVSEGWVDGLNGRIMKFNFFSTYEQNGEWELRASGCWKHYVSYSCCPEVYMDLTYYVVLKRRPLYLILNIGTVISYLFNKILNWIQIQDYVNLTFKFIFIIRYKTYNHKTLRQKTNFVIKYYFCRYFCYEIR